MLPEWIATASHCVDITRDLVGPIGSPFPVYIGGLKRHEFAEVWPKTARGDQVGGKRGMHVK